MASSPSFVMLSFDGMPASSTYPWSSSQSWSKLSTSSSYLIA